MALPVLLATDPSRQVWDIGLHHCRRSCLPIPSLNIVPVYPDDQGAYRSKLAGLFAIVLLVNLLCSWAGITSDSIEVSCDGLSALNKAFDT